MGLLKLQKLCWVLKVSAFICYLLLQGSSAVFSISPSSVVPALPPSDEETTGDVSAGTSIPSTGPSSASQETGVRLHPPLASQPLKPSPGPQMSEDSAPPLLHEAPTSIPPYNFDHPPGTTSRGVPASPPSNNPYESPQQPDNPVIGPASPVPSALPSRPSPESSPERTSPQGSPALPSSHSPQGAPALPSRQSPQGAPALPPGQSPESSPARPSPQESPALPSRQSPQGAPALPSGQSPQRSPAFELPLPVSVPPSSHQNKTPIQFPLTPVNAPAPRMMPLSSPPLQLTKPDLPPSVLPDPVVPAPGKMQDAFQPAQPRLPKEPPTSSPGEFNTPPVSTPNPGIKPGRAGKPVAAPVGGTGNNHSPVIASPTYAPQPESNQGRASKPVAAPLSDGGNHHLPLNPSPTNAPHPDINSRRAGKPVAAPLNDVGNHHPPVNPSPTDAPSQKGMGDFRSVPPPLPYTSAPYPRVLPPAAVPSTTTSRHYYPINITTAPASPVKRMPPASTRKEGSPPFSSPASPPQRTRMTHSRSLPKYPKMPVQALPPPPPNEDCATLTCSEPLTNGPSGPPCLCVLPIKVGLRLSVALYTFFPLVSELAAEISTGVFLELSQVRIMGANEASQDPEKTIVLIDLVPLGEMFDKTTPYLIFQRFWHKQVDIKASLFGNYEVLYVRYPGLPQSPPSASPDIDIIDNDPYHNHGNNSGTIKPLGVDVSRRHENGPNRSIIAIIVLSASLAVILLCAVVWVLLFKNRGSVSQQERNPPTPVLSLEKLSGGGAASRIGSGPSSASMSLASGIAAYTGSAKTYSSSEIERATGNFDEVRVLGEGGFGRVYSGVLDDGTEVAVKVLKRADHQGDREFLAEVEMLSRLHHRNLVKLIGICTEDRSRCLVYELVRNGSVESHLHGVDKGTAPLDWAARLKIALGAARGLSYLHEDSSPRVIHRDFKASNILLEDDFTPKVSDFGLARAALDEENRHISTRVMGTFGYVAPEYAMTGHLLVKSDVYSYGVVLLELLTGRKPVDMSQPFGQENLVSFARPLLTSKEGLELIVDQALGPDFPLDSITKVAAIASMCVQPEVSNRPFMGEVVQALKLVCNECEETKEMGSRSCSQEDVSIYMDARMSTKSEGEPDPHHTPSLAPHYNSRLDVESGLSMSELLSSSVRSERTEDESLRRHSSSGPLRTANAKGRLWNNMRRLSGGSISEHGMMYRFWPGSR